MTAKVTLEPIVENKTCTSCAAWVEHFCESTDIANYSCTHGLRITAASWNNPCGRHVNIAAAQAICASCRRINTCPDASIPEGWHNPGCGHCLLIKAEYLSGRQMFDKIEAYELEYDPNSCYDAGEALHSEVCENCIADPCPFGKDNKEYADAWLNCPTLRPWIKNVFTDMVKEAILKLAILEETMSEEDSEMCVQEDGVICHGCGDCGRMEAQ